MKKSQLFSWVVILLCGILMPFVCSACSLSGSKETCQVTYYVGNEVWKEVEVNQGDFIVFPECDKETETDYYDGWKLSEEGEVLEEGYVVTENINFYADKKAKATITYVAGDVVFKTEYAKPGQEITLTALPETETYYTKGWSLEGGDGSFIEKYTVNEDVTFVAEKIDKALVTYMTGSTTYKVEYVKHGETITLIELPQETDTRYFYGWCLSGDNSVIQKYVVNDDVVFVADEKTKVSIVYMDGETITQKLYKKHGDVIELRTLPAETETYYYKGWTIKNGDGTLWNQGNYFTTNEDTTFIAQKNAKACVSYDFNDGVTQNQTSYVKHGAVITLPALPEDTETHYYKGWRVIGENTFYQGDCDFDVTSDSSITNINFIAEKVAKVVVVYNFNDGVTQNDTRYVKHGEAVILPTLPIETETCYYTGWQIDGEQDLYVGGFNYTITKDITDITFIAKKVNKVTVTYMNGESVYATKYVKPGTKITLISIPNNYADCTYLGWILDGKDYAFGEAYTVIEDVTFIANLVENDWQAKSWGETLNNFTAENVWNYTTDGVNYSVYYSNGNEHYAYNKTTKTWDSFSWTGLIEFNGVDVWTWTDGKSYKCYYSNGTNTYEFKMNAWGKVEGWDNIKGRNVWSDGTNYYHLEKKENGSCNNWKLVLNGEVWSWEKCGDVIAAATEYSGRDIWTDGKNHFIGVFVANDFVQYKYSNGSWILDQSINLVVKGKYVWSQGNKTYYTFDSVTYVYTADKKWVAYQWVGYSPRSGINIWTDGIDVYYSNQTTQYVFNA